MSPTRLRTLRTCKRLSLFGTTSSRAGEAREIQKSSSSENATTPLLSFSADG
jgi:hypothetical protein